MGTAETDVRHVAVVVGAASGLEAAIADALRADGCRVVTADLAAASQRPVDAPVDPIRSPVPPCSSAGVNG